MSAIPIAHIPSRTPTSKARAITRTDPFYDGLWQVGAIAAWMSVDQAKRAEAAGLGRIPKWVLGDYDEALGRLQKRGQLWQAALRLLANVNAYRTLTVEQLAFISGDNRAMSPQAHLVRDMFTLGLVDIGTYQRPMGAPPHAHRTKLIRPSRSSAFHDLILPHMTYPEWATTTGAHPWSASSRYDRHNALVAEIIARAAEFLPIGAVVGERFADVANLAYTSIGDEPPRGLQRAADAVLLREDGARLAIELTASTGKNFTDKVAKWVQLFGNRRWDDTGLHVVFVIAGNAEATEGHHSAASDLSRVRRDISRALRDWRAPAHDPAKFRISVVQWQDWFPGPGLVDSSFLTLRVQRPTGQNADDPWESVDLLDPRQVPTPTNEDLPRSLDMLAVQRFQPSWLAEGRTPPNIHEMRKATSPLRRLTVNKTVTKTGLPVKPRFYPEGMGPPQLPMRLRTKLSGH
ncbi:hypothetical protein [Pseudoclavibacter sp. VKM Ac-2867]|uniref:hypothetical protein n=1 Tax=Pseudoclavibacter sp. VKM Ac-2867 TaxID=2783829 RepID=UPI00188B01F5|nr:hypothetical protein [Pseudoclavibacter sp. VKM Ac-2867]MBF4459530.1 hypothetical protein [Pseudoclavibacter sp. VKM Ac-2867]